MTLLNQFYTNGKTPRIIKNRLEGVKSFIVPKRERLFWRDFPYSRLQFLNCTEYKREEIRAVARSYFFSSAGSLSDMLENTQSGTLKDMKESFYYMQESSKIIWPRLSQHDPLVSLIYTLRTPEFMQERERDFFKSFPEWIQKLIMIFVNSEIKFSNI